MCVQDVDKCIAIMKELENVEMTANLLLKNSDIVTTVRRVSLHSVLFYDDFLLSMETSDRQCRTAAVAER